MAQVPAWITVASPVLSAIASAFLSGYVVTRWKAREDQVERRVDELCAGIQEIANLAAEYWAGTPQDVGMNIREAQIVASLKRIAGLRVLLSEFVSNAATAELEAAEATFFRAVTGGNFGVHNRTAESIRIPRCYSEAAAMIVTVRRSRLRDLRGLWSRN